MALLDHLQIKQAHIVGYSLGGMIAVKLLAMHPERVSSATVGGMGWLREGSRLQETWERIQAHDAFRTPPEFVHTVGQLAVTEDELKKISETGGNRRRPARPGLRLYVAPLRTVRPDWPVVEIENAGHITCVLSRNSARQSTPGSGSNLES